MKILILWLCLISVNVNAGLKELLVQISEEGVQLICQFEGFKEFPYLDVGGVPSIGFGTAYYDVNTRVTMKDPPISQSEAIDLLETNVNMKCEPITDMLVYPVNQNQFDALCSFAYNIGITALKNSTLLSLLNKGDVSGAADQFLLWSHVNGVTVPGLLNRRVAERALFLKGETYASTN